MCWGLGIGEQLNNLGPKPVEFDGLKKEAGLTAQALSSCQRSQGRDVLLISYFIHAFNGMGRLIVKSHCFGVNPGYGSIYISGVPTNAE
jgi:hypothetical protein